MPFNMSKASEHRCHDAHDPPLRETADPASATAPQGEITKLEFGHEFRTRGSARSRFKALLVLTTLATTTGSAHGQSLSPAADDGRFTIKLSAFNTDSRIQLRAGGNADYEGRPFSSPWRASGEIQADRSRPHVQAMFRMTDRQRLTFGHYQTSSRNSYDVDRAWDPSRYRGVSGTHDEFRGAASIPPASMNVDGSFTFDFRLANLMYEYALFQNETWSFGGGIGITWADLEFNSRAQGTIQFDSDVETIDASYQWRRKKFAPALGLRGIYSPIESWHFTAEAQGFQTSWGNFGTLRGHFERFGINGEYRFRRSRNFGVHVGYDWFRLKLSDDVRGGFDGNELTYTGRAVGGLRVHGPTVGLTVAL